MLAESQDFVLGDIIFDKVVVSQLGKLSVRARFAFTVLRPNHDLVFPH